MTNRVNRRERRAALQAAMMKWLNEDYPLIQFEAAVFGFPEKYLRVYEADPLPLRYSRRRLVRGWIDLAKDWPQDATALGHFLSARLIHSRDWYSWNPGARVLKDARASVKFHNDWKEGVK